MSGPSQAAVVPILFQRSHRILTSLGLGRPLLLHHVLTSTHVPTKSARTPFFVLAQQFCKFSTNTFFPPPPFLSGWLLRLAWPANRLLLRRWFRRFPGLHLAYPRWTRYSQARADLFALGSRAIWIFRWYVVRSCYPPHISTPSFSKKKQ